MTPTPQLELHPDADSLNAFVERALADSEREQVLAHLVACSRCRQVIYLAQEAAEPAATAWAPVAPPAMQSGPWFRNWRLIWVPATALAVALVLMLVFHPRHTASAPELAKVAPQTEQSASRPESTEPSDAGMAHIPAPAASAKSIPGKPRLSASRAAVGESTTVAAPSAAMPDEPGTFTFQNQMSNHRLPPLGSTAPGLAPQPATAQFKPESVAHNSQMDLQLTAGVVSGNVPPAHTSSAGFRGSPIHGQASRAVSLATAAPPIKPQPMVTNNFAVAAQGPMVQAMAPRAFVSIRLPSGLTAVSTATEQHHMLAIDLTGALFLSEDAGENWKPVVRQWTGRAVEVRAKRSLSVSAAPAGVLELINDAGSVWVSTDGNTWTMP